MLFVLVSVYLHFLLLFFPLFFVRFRFLLWRQKGNQQAHAMFFRHSRPENYCYLYQPKNQIFNITNPSIKLLHNSISLLTTNDC